MFDDIIHSLNLKVENVESISHAFKNNTHFYFIKLVSRGIFCPNCGQYTQKVHEYKTISLNHSIFIAENASVIYKARRYICPHCSKTAFEHSPFKSHHPRLTLKTIQNVLLLLKDYNQTFSMVAKKTNLSVTEVMTIFDEYVQIERKNFLRPCVLMSSSSLVMPKTNMPVCLSILKMVLSLIFFHPDTNLI